MNFFRGLSYVNITGSLFQAIFLFVVVFSPLIFFPSQVIFTLPLVTAIVLGYMVRATPDIIDGAPDMASFNVMSLIMDFARGLITLVVGISYFAPSIVVSGRLNSFLLTKGYMTDGDHLFIGLAMIFLLSMSLLLLSVGMIRFGLTNDVRVYLHMRHNINLIRSHFWASFSFVANILVSLSVLGVGFISCLIPGLLLFPIWIFVLCYLLACYARDLDVAPMQEKRKNDLLYAPDAEPEKQK